MFTIGICDDEANARKRIADLCTNIVQGADEKIRFLLFDSGEAVLKYVADRTAETIDLLFLDIEMQGMDGLETRDRLRYSTKIARIAFVTSHTEQMAIAFGIRTVGFVSKPITEVDLARVLNYVMTEKRQQTLFELPVTGGTPRAVRTENIYYFEADGNYTTIFYYDEAKEKYVSEVLVMKIGKIEETLAEKDFVRIHKSYLVNLLKVSNLTDKVTFLEIDQTFTVGRKYKTTAREAFLGFVARKARERL